MMKKSIIAKAMILALGLAAVSCSDVTGDFGSGKGRLAPTVGCDSDVEGMGQTLSRAAGDITADDLSLTLSKDDGSYRQTWDKISDFDVEKQFSVGNYTLTAFYGDPQDEGFDKPAFIGSAPVKIADGQTSQVSLTATVANSKISVVYTDAFKKYMADYSGQFVTSKAAYDYGKDEVRPLHVAPGQVAFNVHVVKPNGNEATFEVAKLNTEARHHYVITVDLNSGNVSDAVLEVTFDDTLEQEPVTIDLSDEILMSPIPQITAEGFTPGTPVELMAGVNNNVKVQLNLQAMAGFKSVTLTTESEYLQANGWPATLDLLAATDAEQAMMKARGLRVVGLWGNVGTMALLDFGPMTEYIVAGDYRFTVSITDDFGRTLETPVTLELSLYEPGFELSVAEGTYFTSGMPISFNLSTNIAITQDKLKLEYKNSRGTTSELPIIGFAESESRTSTYTITVTAPSDVENTLKLKLSCGRIGSNELEIPATPFDLSFTDSDVFATHAYMDILPTAGNAAPDLSAAQIVFCNADGSFTNASKTAVSTYFDVTSLSADTQYTVRAKIGNNYSKAHTFRTEKNTQLPNSGMEEWSNTAGKSSYWSIDYVSADKNNLIWDTMNLLTTSEGGSAGAPGCGYCAKSGTTPVSDAHSGKAALIQTVGWGNGNTAWRNTIGSGISGGKCENLTVGELYLGHYDTSSKTAVYDGHVFASRPSSVKFWAKYVPKNSADWGTAEARILASDGTIISSKNITIPKTDAYTQFSVPFTYTRGSKCAAKIVVIFKSSGNTACQAINNNNLSSPPSSTVTTSQGYIGSKLYIDDIELTY